MFYEQRKLHEKMPVSGKKPLKNKENPEVSTTSGFLICGGE